MLSLLSQSLVIIEIDDIVTRENSNKPCLHVTWTSRPANEELLQSFRRSKRLLKQASKQLLEIRKPDSTSLSSEAGLKSQKSETCRELAHAGFTVNPTPESAWRVYVVEKKCSIPAHADQLCVYVGTSSKDQDERIAEHLAGKSDSAARGWQRFVRRRKDLEPSTLRISHSLWNAEVHEEEWARILTARGLHVTGPRGFGRKLSRGHTG